MPSARSAPSAVMSWKSRSLMVCQMPLLPEATSFSRNIIKAKPAARPQTRDTAIFLASAEPLFLFFSIRFSSLLSISQCVSFTFDLSYHGKLLDAREKSAFQAIFSQKYDT